jgi:hypothetical protein
MALVDVVRDVHAANRLAAVEDRSKKIIIKGDFEGTVTGSWVEIAQNGAGIVSYNNKQYVTKPLGFTSIPAGHAVQLTYAKGIYYSEW